MLKPHVRDKRLYGALTSGLCWSPWLIPHNVLLNAQNAGSADKRTRPWVHPRSSVFHRPIQYGRPNYIGEYTREPGFEPYMQQCCCTQRLFDTHIVWHNHRTHNTRPHCHFDWLYGGWLCNGGWTLGMDQWETICFPTYRLVPYSRYWHWGIRTQTNYHFGMINKRLQLVPMPWRRLSWTRGFNSYHLSVGTECKWSINGAFYEAGPRIVNIIQAF